jgi:hypothetical protein
MSIQVILLRILRRIYLLGEDGMGYHGEDGRAREGASSGAVGLVKGPLFLVMRNISLFSEGQDD